MCPPVRAALINRLRDTRALHRVGPVAASTAPGGFRAPNITNMENLHVLRIQYHGPTNHRGSRVSITSDRFEQRVTIPFDHAYRHTLDIAAAYLKEHGYNVLAQAEGPAWDYVITDTFKALKK